MALSAFHDRLQHMEHTRNERLSLLQAEKESQAKKSHELAAKLAGMGVMEQRCLVLEQSIAAHSFQIWSLRSEIERLDSKSQTDSENLRVLKSEVEELEELEKDKMRLYEVKRFEMKEFKLNVARFASECQSEIENLRHGINEVKSKFAEFQGSDNCTSNGEIAAAEKRKSELLAMKEEMSRKLASNYLIRARLQKQLQDVRTTSSQH